ncbi:MAG: hypothetical protein IKU68_06675 [Oscillospiraceae bacterium]|nr:hypothetical protein [Oscillospiraceae bacterium]
MDIILQKFDYKYLPYEQNLLRLEIKALFPNSVLDDSGRQLILRNICEADIPALDRLTYIAAYYIDNECYYTKQYKLEHNKSKSPKRQNTRYASHGLHEYKGKFNPQIVHALLNILGANGDCTVLDPFCGSGTTLVESAICGFSSYGFDINPLAAQLATLKVNALTIDCVKANELLIDAIDYFSHGNSATTADVEKNPRNEYLLNWLPEDIFLTLEQLLQYTANIDEITALLFKITASNLIRDYSLQEPLDLRIRRRTSPMPETPFVQAWSDLVVKQLENISQAQKHIGDVNTNSTAELNDIRTATANHTLFDIAITSPPYAAALPYIDTQRISLVWLGLCEPRNIMGLESTLIGSREFYRVQKDALLDKMLQNVAALPNDIISLIMELQNKLTDQDGFRKKAVPLLLYRYFSDMQKMFCNVCTMMKQGAKFALVVGNNKTTIGGNTTIIDTPALLAQIAAECGWRVIDLMPLQTYQRYGLNAKNAITCETLILLEKGTD